jgi:hypothetical protein
VVKLLLVACLDEPTRAPYDRAMTSLSLLRAPLTALLSLLPIVACGKLGFDIEQDIPEQQVEGHPLAPLLLPEFGFAFPLSIDLESQTQAQGTGAVSSASLKSFELSLTSPAGETFEFLDSIAISISAPGLETKMVAGLADVPAQPRISLQIVVPEVDLLPYIQKGATMKATATGHVPRQTVRFEGTVVIRVKI